MKGIVSVVLSGVVASASPAYAQTATARAAAEQKQMRYQIGVMERVLEGAVEHGAKEIRDRLQTVLPTETTLISDNARVRGFRLEGYGVFFDVVVPSLLETMPWTFRTLDQNNLGLDSALRALKAHVQGAGDPGLQQAFERIELQVDPATLTRAASAPAAPGVRNATGSVAATATAAPTGPADTILNDPEEAYRTEVKQALMDAMLDHSSSLGLGSTEWMTVAARRSDDRSQLAPADSDARTVLIRVRGSDLSAFLARQISREEVLQRMEVRVF